MASKVVKMPPKGEEKQLPLFFHYRQNNSGGSFDIDHERGISVNVIIEATDAKAADAIAENIGLYFDGAGDCSCCGDRWSPQSDWIPGDGDAVPSIHSTPVWQHYTEDPKWGAWTDGSEYDCFVHYLNGTIVGYQHDSIIETKEEC